jgi:glycosyltransferase involved in cell wall biosynthesis
VKTGRPAVSVLQMNYAFDTSLTDPDELLERYFTLTGWSEALLGAGAARAGVVQRFHRDARVTRNGVDYLFIAGGARPLARAAAAWHPDVAHVNGLVFPAQTWLLRRSLPASMAIVVQSHSDGGAIGRAPALRAAGRAARGAVDAFLFAAPEHAAAWRDAGFVAGDQPAFFVMPASTTLRPIARAEARARAGVTGTPAILWVGRLNANKDPLTVLDGFDRAAARLPQATLTMIYGDDDLLPAVRARIDASAALQARVRLAGMVPHADMSAFFSAADLFAVGSHHEGSGYSLMEACACGAVPVVTDIPTFRLLTGGLGALWRPGDAADFTRALIDVASRDLDGERARVVDDFTSRLTWAAVGRQAMQIYADVLSRRHAIIPSA